jgi:hypothetical protein
MEQLSSSFLFHSLTSLTETAEQLSVQLTQAAKKLHDTGEIPREDLLEAVTDLRERFLTLKEQGLATAEALATPTLPQPETLLSLDDLKTLAQGVAAEEEKRARYDDILQQALAVLDRVLSIYHREQPNFSPLQDCHVQARTMREAITAMPWPNLHPAAEALAKGADPFSDLLTWVAQKDALDDDEWELLHETVEHTFGKALATAASRGKLALPAGSAVQQDFRPTPLPTAAHVGTAGGLQSALDLYSPALNEQDTTPQALFPMTPVSEVDEVLIDSEDSSTAVPEQFVSVKKEQTTETTDDETSPSVDAELLGSLYSFSPTDTAQQIASAITQTQDLAARPTLLRDLTWRLLFEDKGSQAFHVASYLDACHPHLPHRLPPWLLRSVVLGRHVRHASGEAARFLEADLRHFSPSFYPPAQQEWNQAMSLLLAAATLQPALLAPQTQAPVILRALRWEMPLPQLAAYCQSVADYGVRQQPLDPNLLKKGKEQVAWQSEMETLKQAVELWWTRAPRLTFTFAPATKVWQKWLEPKGVIATFLSPIRYNDTSKLAVMQRTVDRLAEEEQLRREIEQTDRNVLGRQLGNEINGRPLEQLLQYTREALGFVRRWIELQEIRSGQRRGPIHTPAERLRQTVQELHEAAQEELNLLKRKNPSPLILSGLTCCRRAMDNLALLFDPDAAFPTEEPLPRPLLYADLLRIPSVSLNDKWEIESSSWEALADGILDLVANSTQKKTAF